MGKLKNRSTIPQGMLAPSGLRQTHVNPNVQATTRPAGTLLLPSPGYDSIRRGKNRFQGKGPSGGFREQTFAEEIGGSGSALSVVPGSTTSDQVSEWLPESPDTIAEGSVIVADRGSAQEPSYATRIHEGLNTIPDMGDRNAARALSKSKWLHNPVGMFREDYRKDPVLTVVIAVALLAGFRVVAGDLEREYRSYRGRGVATAATAGPAAVASTTGKETADAANAVGEAADRAVAKIEQATNDAVTAIEDTAKSAKNTVTED